MMREVPKPRTARNKEYVTSRFTCTKIQKAKKADSICESPKIQISSRYLCGVLSVVKIQISNFYVSAVREG